ncbi:O-antigen ligase domain-containing protein [Parabacteroides sp. PF5-6]|uniref:O-antigen ligase domain-containing protein n=1 Tax=Parabacteroides sp. PF5-6 TaxID=1742403 RepID=UPI002406DA54|nr:O-antigen ligase domain-containing protein [Parabacteroides sp. PF5-6]MDF9830657.1 hypothetical protein [Parabacteroides sp. PF5-6]
MVQSYINKYFFFLFIFAFVFVILLYYTIGFQFTDELTTMFLFILFLFAMFKTPDWAFNKVFLLTLGIFLFYTIYSLWIGSNAKRAIFNDLIIQLKPYLGFFCVYQLRPVLNKSRKSLFKEITLLFWFIFLLPIGLIGAFSEPFIEIFMRHPAIYGIAITITGLCYLYSSDYSKRDKIIFMLLLSIGIISGRSKFYGFFVLSLFLVFLLKPNAHFKLSMKNIMIFLVLFGLMFYVAWEKIYIYFVQALTDNPDVDKDMMARFVIYRVTPEILTDYFPFGTGFASFATHSSGIFYSGTYAEYGLDNVYGLTKNNPKFVSDTFYPSLAQFGVVGVILYILFWLYILRKAFSYFKADQQRQLKSLVIVILITGFIAIEGTTGSTFIAQGGLFVMMLLGLILSDMKHIAEETPQRTI